MALKRTEVVWPGPNDFFYYRAYPVSIPYREGYTLSDEGRERLHNWCFEYDGYCTCFQSAPCAACTHPDNPAAINEDDSCWREITLEEVEEWHLKRWASQYKRQLRLEKRQKGKGSDES